MWLIGTQKTGGYVPEGLGTVTPYLHPRGTPGLIEFLKQAFDAEELMRIEHGGAIRHARVKIGDSVLEMSEIQPEHQPMAAAFHLFVPDTDAVYRRAIEAGGQFAGRAARPAVWGTLRVREGPLRLYVVHRDAQRWGVGRRPTQAGATDLLPSTGRSPPSGPWHACTHDSKAGTARAKRPRTKICIVKTWP
jgi:uncharacterized glyoxalase superfamily protein PhnB